MAAIQYFTIIIFAFLSTSMASREVRNVVSGKTEIWPRGRIVYTISSIFDDAQKKIIEDAMKEIEEDSSVHGQQCVEFLTKTGVNEFASDYVQFRSSGVSECIVDVGRQHGRQAVYIGDSCMTRSGMLPILLGILGLYHEHRRPDRDTYIQVHMDNVIHEYQTLFSKLDPSVTDLLGLPYDYDSVTHFGPYEHAINRQKPTITTNTSCVTFGDKTGLSVYDVVKVQKLYQCGVDTSHIKVTPTFHRSQIKKLPSYVDCTYEQPFCNLVNDVIHNGSPWLITKSGVVNGFPDKDATLGNGSYIYTNSNGSTLVTIRNIPAGTVCVELSYCGVNYTTSGDRNTSTGFSIYAETYQRAPMEIWNNFSYSPYFAWSQFRGTVKSAFSWRMLIRSWVDPGKAVVLDDISVVTGLCTCPNTTSKTIDLTVT